MTTFLIVGVVAVVVFMLVSAAVKIVQEYGCGVIFRLGRLVAKQAEAEREKRANIIHAEGEFSASQQLAAAAQLIDSQPATLQLRYLQTLTVIAAEKNGTIVFPLPIDLIQMLLEGRRSTTAEHDAPKNRKVPWPPIAAA